MKPYGSTKLGFSFLTANKKGRIRLLFGIRHFFLGKPSYFFGVVEPQVVLLFFVEFVVVDLVASVADGLVACPFIVFLSSFITVKLIGC